MNEIMKHGDTQITPQTEQNMIVAGETAASVQAAMAKAEIEARLMVAIHRPRSWTTVREKMLDACNRPGFAAIANQDNFGAAWFSVKNKGQGFSVRFAEEAMRNMGNMDVKNSVLYEDDDKRIIKVEVFDLEANISLYSNVVVKKVIERKFLKKGEVAISQRENSYGDIVYLRAATDDEITPMQNSAISKARRNLIMQMVPGDIQSECRQAILGIINGQVPEDPKAQTRQICDNFKTLGVSSADLEEFLGHKIDGCSPPEMEMLRSFFAAIRAGEASFYDELELVREMHESTDGNKPTLADWTDKYKKMNPKSEGKEDDNAK